VLLLDFHYIVAMGGDRKARWYRLTPDRVVILLLAVEGFLLLSEWFGWFPFNQHKGYTVLIAMAAVAAAMLLMLLWFLAALLFRLRFQFSIRSLLLLAVVVAIPCSWLATEMKKAREQRAIVGEVKKAADSVIYDYQVDPLFFYGNLDATPTAPLWLRNLLGDDLFADVKHVFFPEHRTISDAGWQHLKELTQLERLVLSDTKVSDADLQHLEGLTQLKELYLQGTQVGDAGLRHITGLTQLERLDLDGTKVADAGLQYVRRLTELEMLALRHTKVSGAGLEHLKGLSQLKELYLTDTQVGDAGLQHLKGLTQLRDLELDGTKVSDAGLEHVKGLTQLEELDLKGTDVTGAGVRNLQKALPSTTITGP
jgi:hypothetical protein